MTALWLLIVLQLADVLTTWYVIRAGGREANPIMVWLIDRIGFWPAFGVMKAAVIWLAWLTVETPVPLLLSVLYLVVVINNLRVYRRLKKEQANAP